MTKIIVIASGKGGTGKTSLAAGVGAALARREQKVLVVDGDSGLRNLDIVLGMSDRVVFSFADVASGMIPLTEAAAHHPDLEKLFLLTAPAEPLASGALTADGMRLLARQANEENFKVLRSWNVNLMRLQLNTSDELARTDLQAYRKFIDTKINDVIPRVLDLGKKYGVMIIIDLHTVPGSARMTEESDAIYGNEAAVNEFLHIWRRIAAKFKGHPALYGYDLINEPKQTRRAKTDYLELQCRAAEAIREIDPETPIYIESNMMDSPLAFYFLSPLKLKNIIYQCHFYEPFDYTHYFIQKKRDLETGKTKYRIYPGTYYGTFWGPDLVQIRKKLSYVREFEKKHRAKIYVGEFSAFACAPGADAYLRDCIRVFEEYGWDWTYHAFREGALWSVEHEGPALDSMKQVSSTPRKEVLLNAFRNNRKGK